VREMRGGKLYDARYHARGRGQGAWAEQLGSLFAVTSARLGLGRSPNLSAEGFRGPPVTAGRAAPTAQMELF